ncbi:MAG: polyprenyl diphosphate synthase [Planctomycetota bacterium]|nr:polyprenyl diphosphate synthase [Planctomycetota bacterium]
MSEIPSDIDLSSAPRHIAIIMDGNGRWARRRNKRRSFGHRKGAERVRPVVELCKKTGVKYLTLYAFSSENWKRSSIEINFLWRLLSYFLKRELADLKKEGVRLNVIGEPEQLPLFAQNKLRQAIEELSANDEVILTLALNYGSRGEIVRAVKRWNEDVEKGVANARDLDEEVLAGYLDTAGMPDPDLVVRTAGEMRLSNFLLYQASYSELYVTSSLWPDFGDEQFFDALRSFQKRVRRFGGLVEDEDNL